MPQASSLSVLYRRGELLAGDVRAARWFSALSASDPHRFATARLALASIGSLAIVEAVVLQDEMPRGARARERLVDGLDLLHRMSIRP